MDKKYALFLYIPAFVFLVGSAFLNCSTQEITPEDSNNITDSLKIATLTFNQGGKKLVNDNIMHTHIRNWLNLANKNLDGQPEVLLIALQEAGDDSIIKYISSQTSLQLIYQDKKQQLTLGSMYNAVFANAQTTKLISKNGANCGAFPNKGFLYATVNAKGFYLQPFSAHLPSDPKKPQERNNCLIKAMKNATSDSTVIFSGDLNYRVSDLESPTPEQTTIIQNLDCCKLGNAACVQEGKTLSKPQNDQLSNALTNYLSSTGLYEKAINFSPTCRLKESTGGERDEKCYDTKRIPSFCDRTLVRQADNTKSKANIDIKNYINLEISPKSDHLGVASFIELTR